MQVGREAARWLAFTLPGRAALGLVTVVVVVVTVVAPRFAGAAPTTQPRTAQVARGNVLQTVSVSGAVNAGGTVRLNFSTAGKLAEVLVKVGDQVAKDQPLARLEATDLQTTVRQREADLATQQARYDTLTKGVTGADLALAQNSLEQSRRAYEDAKRTAANDIAAADRALATAKTSYLSSKTTFATATGTLRADATAYQTSLASIRSSIIALRDALQAMNRPGDVTTAKNALDAAQQSLASAETFATLSVQSAAAEYGAMTDAILAAIDAFDRAVAAGSDTSAANATLQNAGASFDTAGTRLSSAIDGAGAPVNSALTSANSAYSSLTTANVTGDTSLDQARSDLVRIQVALQGQQQLATTMKGRITQASASLTSIEGSVNGGYLNALQSHTTAAQRAESTLATQASALRTAELQYEKSTGGSSASDVASAAASLLSAQVALDKAKNDLANATLRAPTAGYVASIAAQPGESVTTGGATGFMVVANTSALTLHGTVGEGEVANLKLGQAATVTVDAIGAAKRMTGRIVALDPVATMQQGVPVYGVDIQIDVPDSGVRAGMSATAAIIVASKQDVLTVPNLAVRSSSGRRFVQTIQEGKVTDADVTFGISNDTVTEIMSGLKEGDTVVLPQPRAAASQQPQQGAGGLRVPGGGVQGPVIQQVGR